MRHAPGSFLTQCCSRARYLVFACLILIVPHATAGVTFRIVDQSGQPIENVVVSAPVDADRSATDELAVMDQVNKQFLPHVLVVQKGQRVSFPNSDDIRHHVYSFSSPKPFEIKLYKGKHSTPIEFDKPGIVVLGCNIHDHMVGYIYVADRESVALTNRDGVAHLELNSDRVHMWHSRLSTSHTERIDVAVNEDTPDATQLVTLQLLPEKPPAGKRKFGSKFD